MILPKFVSPKIFIVDNWFPDINLTLSFHNMCISRHAQVIIALLFRGNFCQFFGGCFVLFCLRKTLRHKFLSRKNFFYVYKVLHLEGIITKNLNS